nr:zinc finger protein 704-like isoform X2 [Procambarus clarkii]
MSTGKRLAKRSILGTRVACCLEDGKYYAGVICAVKTSEEGGPTVYTVRVEGDRRSREVRETDLVGSGFTPVGSVKLRAGQRVFITHNNREVSGNVLYHRPNIDEVLISVVSPETGVRQDVKKRIEEIRLLECRKSARLADQDTDFAKLADMSTDRKDRKPSQTIDVPAPSGLQGSRKRRSSHCEEDQMDECAAAMVLMKLSCSPRSPLMPDGVIGESPGSSVSSGVWSWVDGSSSSSSSSSRSPAHRSATPSPPLSESCPAGTIDDGLELDDTLFDDALPRKRRSSTRTMFKCTWTGCHEMTAASDAIERHIRSTHLGREEVNSDHSESDSDDDDDHEEEFYWTEVEVNVATWVDPCEPLVSCVIPAVTPPAPPTALKLVSSPPTPAPTPNSSHTVGVASPSAAVHQSPPQYVQVSSPPTLSHMDMARPPHEDPRYKQHLGCPSSNLSSSWPRSSAYLGTGRGKIRVSSSPKASPGRGKRNGESRKCRKVYGMEQRDLWCTQCKWKKACSRFGE